MRRAVFIVCLLAIVADSFYLGATFGRFYELQRIVYELPTGANVLAQTKRTNGSTLSATEVIVLPAASKIVQ